MQPGRTTIVIPTFNDDPAHLRESVTSALSQTWPDVEVVVVNDGSTRESTLAELAELAALEGICVVSQPNRGLAAARNAGISHSTGEFIVPLDADDWIDATFVEEGIAVLHEANVVAAYPNVDQFGLPPRPLPPVGVEVNLVDIIYRNRIVATSMFRRSSWELYGGYDEALRSLEDWELWVRFLVSSGGVMRMLPTAQLHYRLRHGSLSTFGHEEDAHDLARVRMVANNPEHGAALLIALDAFTQRCLNSPNEKSLGQRVLGTLRRSLTRS